MRYKRTYEHTYEAHGNIHMHTTYSDGTGQFGEVVAAASQANLDFIYVTDHNILVREQEEGYRRGVLTLVGQEVHDTQRVPERNHLLCLGVQEDVTSQACNAQRLIDSVAGQGALSFLAHPFEQVTPLAPDHWQWEDWDVTRYTGVELWNYMSSFRGFTTSRLRSVILGYWPHLFLRGPLPVMVRKWDELTQTRPVVAIGGTDVHAWTYHMGPLRRVFLPYLHCAQALNTHILTERPFLRASIYRQHDYQDERVQRDRELVLAALAAGHCWTGYDLAHPTRGFRFHAWQLPRGRGPLPKQPPHALMGDTLAEPKPGETTYFQAIVPARAEIRLFHNGKLIDRRIGRHLNHINAAPGVYRIEAWLQRWGQLRGWIFSNPIYVRT